MEMMTVYIITDPAAPRLRRENRRLHRECIISVSYTHLDVYKRQEYCH